MRAYASIQVISTDALEGLYDLNEASSGWVGETESRTETNTPQIGKWRIPVHELYAKPKATQKLLDDASINMEAWLAGKVAEKFARDESTAFVSGNGINKPRGFLTYTSGTTIPGMIEQIKTVGQLRVAMEKLASNPSLREKYGAESRKIFLENFQFKDIVKMKFIPIYEK
jgi:HK97 family phage major capsid protein